MLCRRAALALLAAALPGAARAQDFPTKPVRILVPYPPAGPVDAAARIVAQEISAPLGQNVVVENIAGGAGAIGTRAVARAEADGHTLVLGTNQTHAANLMLLKEPGYHPVNDFAPVAALADLQHALVVRKDLGVTDVPGFVALAKVQEGKLNYGSSGAGSASHLAMELLKVRTGIAMQHVPFRGAAPMVQELMGGRIDAAYATLPSVLGQIEAGSVVALALASDRRAPQLPNLALLKEQGVTGGEADAWVALFAPAATPPAVLDRLGRAIADAMAKPEVAASFAKQGFATNFRDGAAFHAYLATELVKWAEVVKAAGVKPE